MDTVPVTFVDDTLGRLHKSDMKSLFSIPKIWSSLAATHYTRRRSVELFLAPHASLSQVGIYVHCDSKEASFQLDPKYDRITRIALRHFAAPLDVVSMMCFKKKVLKMIGTMALDCTLRINGAGYNERTKEFYDVLFDGLKGVPGLTNIDLDNCGEKCYEFVKHQIDLGNLKKIKLQQPVRWPTSMQISLISFAKSSNFETLDVRRVTLFLDFEMVNHFFEQFFSGKLNSGASLHGETSFPLSAFKGLYSESGTIPSGWPRPGSYAIWSSENQMRLQVYVRLDHEVDIFLV